MLTSTSLPGDVGFKERVDEFVTALQTLEDHIDVLINCAGINRPWKAEASEFDSRHNDPDAVEKLLWHGLDDDEFHSTYSINVNGVYFVSTRMVPLLRKSSAPSVIVVASIAGMMLQRQVLPRCCACDPRLTTDQDSWSIVVPHLQSEFTLSPDRIDTDWLGCDITLCKSACLAIYTVSLRSQYSTFCVLMRLSTASRYGSTRSSPGSFLPK